jgi:hypothetical protein
MTKKFFFLVVAILMGGMTAVKAKINYVPLYIVDTKPDVSEPHRIPAAPLFITQDDHKLILPEFEDSVTFMLYKDDNCIYAKGIEHNQSTVNLSIGLVGDYEVRLCADTYYCYGYLTLEGYDEQDGVPTENANWENIMLLGSNTSQQAILDYIMGLNVVEYNMKVPVYLKDEESEEYSNEWDEIHSQRRFGLLPEELSAIFPSLVYFYEDGGFGINYMDLVPILISCIQELKTQLDARTETIVDIMMARGATPTAVREIGAAIGNTLLSAPPTSVNEPARVRYLLTDKATNAYIAVTDMSGRVMTRVPVSPSDTSVSIDSSALSEEGIFLCTLYVNGEIIGTKRLVKTK